MEIPIPQWIIDIVLWFVALFTPAEWKAMVLLILVTLCGTQVVKIVWRALPFTVGGHKALVNLFAVGVGYLAAWKLWAGPSPWWLIGLIPGPLAITLFKSFFPMVQWLLPGLARILNADRRRDPYGLPPMGVGERRRP